MSRFTVALALASVVGLASATNAQAPNARPGSPMRQGPVGPPMGMGAPMGPAMDIGSFLLSHTGELKLSDQQVTRLAAISRRAADRRDAMRRSMDSLFASRGAARGDSARRDRVGPPPGLAANGQRMRDQMHADLREALSVLTPDQQATSWEILAMRGAGGPRAGMAMWGGPRGGGWMRGRPGAGGPGARRGEGRSGGPGMAPGAREENPQ